MSFNCLNARETPATKRDAYKAAGLWASLCVAGLFLAACSSSAPVRYFTLQGPAAEACTTTAGAAPLVQLLKVSVPEALDRPQLVFRTGDNTLSVNESARWAEPLKSGLSGTLAAALMQALGCAPVVWGSVGTEDATWTVSVDIQRFDARRAQSVVLEAQWSLRARSDGKIVSRRSVVQETVAGDSLEAIVAAETRAVAGLARDIAHALKGRAPG